jgi:hypothetical protein
VFHKLYHWQHEPICFVRRFLILLKIAVRSVVDCDCFIILADRIFETVNDLLWLFGCHFFILWDNAALFTTATRHQWMAKAAVILKHSHSLHLQCQCCVVLDVVFMLIHPLMACVPNVSKPKMYHERQSVEY